MEKPRPIWQDLPRHLKVYVAGKLGDKSRQSLRQCSKTDRDVVDSIPFSIHSVVLGPNNPSEATLVVTTELSHSVRHLPYKTAIRDFINLIKNPKSKMNFVTFGLENPMCKLYSELIAEFQKLKIRANRFALNGVAWPGKLGDDQIELLKLMDTKVLKVIEISPTLNDEFLRKLVETEQWKSVRGVSLCTENCENVDLESFFHLREINLRGFQQLNEEAKIKIIENFRQRDLPVNSFFYISKPSVPIGLAMEERENLEEYEMSTPGNKLIVEDFGNKIHGRVISEKDPEIYLNMDQLFIQMHNM
uniref:FTH domain-containing protein n=1 Tax=Caenorhabditis tropicalis TaxID=1561998 RepID=A0A1I7V240_9PELO